MLQGEKEEPRLCKNCSSICLFPGNWGIPLHNKPSVHQMFSCSSQEAVHILRPNYFRGFSDPPPPFQQLKHFFLSLFGKKTHFSETFSKVGIILLCIVYAVVGANTFISMENPAEEQRSVFHPSENWKSTLGKLSSFIKMKVWGVWGKAFEKTENPSWKMSFYWSGTLTNRRQQRRSQRWHTKFFQCDLTVIKIYLICNRPYSLLRIDLTTRYLSRASLTNIRYQGKR